VGANPFQDSLAQAFHCRSISCRIFITHHSGK